MKYRKLFDELLDIMRHSRTLYLLVLLGISGCGSLETDCLSLAPTGTWSKAGQPSIDILEKFTKPEVQIAAHWFKNREEQYGVCYSCGEPENKANSFQMQGENIVAATCDPS